MAFTKEQIEQLEAQLAREYVKERKGPGGITLSYIEGWRAIAEANRIFGFDAWSRETLSAKCVFEGERQVRFWNKKKDAWDFKEALGVTYTARVRITIWDGEREIVREGSGVGHGLSFAQDIGDAHEQALKEAETDAMKRAFSTFGNPFGLALYDPSKENVTEIETERPAKKDEDLSRLMTAEERAKLTAMIVEVLDIAVEVPEMTLGEGRELAEVVAKAKKRRLSVNQAVDMINEKLDALRAA